MRYCGQLSDETGNTLSTVILKFSTKELIDRSCRSSKVSNWEKPRHVWWSNLDVGNQLDTEYKYEYLMGSGHYHIQYIYCKSQRTDQSRWTATLEPYKTRTRTDKAPDPIQKCISALVFNRKTMNPSHTSGIILYLFHHYRLAPHNIFSTEIPKQYKWWISDLSDWLELFIPSEGDKY
jgi:hypothetical protein